MKTVTNNVKIVATPAARMKPLIHAARTPPPHITQYKSDNIVRIVTESTVTVAPIVETAKLQQPSKNDS